MQVLWPEDLGLQCLRPRSYDTMIWNCVKFPSNDKCFDLSGRRVSRMTKGIYIVGGRKVAK